MERCNELMVENRKISFRTGASGFRPERRTLVFIHGSGGSHADWERQITGLEGTFNIAALDMPGHGRSQGPAIQDVFEYVDFIKAFLDTAGIMTPVLIGHSLGAAICMGFAIRHGSRAAAIVPVGGGVKMPVNTLILDGLKDNPVETIATIAKFSVARANRERLSGHLVSAISMTDPATTRGDFLACDALDITDAVTTITIPTLIICGEEDKMTPPAMSEYLHHNIPGSRFHRIPSAGHFAMLENDVIFNSILTGFVSSLPV